MKNPILQRRLLTEEGNRTIAGLGSWEGWLFSEEMENAIKNGYEIEIIRGYEFDPKVIFDEYIKVLYQLRLSYPKGHPMNLIAKLLMNSLYGKFAQKKL